ncbi:MAG: hypothetical protein QM711_17415 [Micropruina sp.]|uniref:hypothetical protein n=1 Tax=Micropruina sp. TaxID=2737536 RepID=UPI0039E57398
MIGLYLQASRTPAPNVGSVEWLASQLALAASAFCLGVAANQVITRGTALAHTRELAEGPLARLDEELAELMGRALSWVRNPSHDVKSYDLNLIHALESFQSHAKASLTELANTFDTRRPGDSMAGLTDHSTILTCTGCASPPNSFPVVIPAGRLSQVFTCVQCYHVLTLYRDNRLDVSNTPLTRPTRSRITDETKDAHGRPTPILECENGHQVEAKVRGQGMLLAVCMTCHSAPTVTNHQFASWRVKKQREKRALARAATQPEGVVIVRKLVSDDGH